jgi:tetratricopeptide (TPR) repeat protein
MIFVCLLATAIGAPTCGWAQRGAELNRQCYGSGNPDQTIEACTTVIAAGFVDVTDLAAAFKIRGNAYDDMGQYDSAIDDYGHAMAIKPEDADVFNNRGGSYGAQEIRPRDPSTTTGQLR